MLLRQRWQCGGRRRWRGDWLLGHGLCQDWPGLLFELDNLYERYGLEFFTHLHQIIRFRIVLKFKCAIPDIRVQYFYKQNSTFTWIQIYSSDFNRHRSAFYIASRNHLKLIVSTLLLRQNHLNNLPDTKTEQTAQHLLLNRILFIQFSIWK